MFSKKIFTLVAGYIAGSVVTSMFSTKKGDELQEELAEAKKKGKDTKKIVVNHFIETQKNLFKTLRDEALSEDNMKLLKKKKTEVLKLVDDYKAEGEKLLADLKENGEEYITTAKEQLEKVYIEKKSEIKNIKGEDVKKAGGKIMASFEDIKKKMKK